MDWDKTVFLHIGWASRYDGGEAPVGGHRYLKGAIGVEAANFRPVHGWCYGYAPVGRSAEGRGVEPIPEGHRTLNIDKLGAWRGESQIDGVTVVWTANRPDAGPVLVGLYDDATVFRQMPPERRHIARARVEHSHLLPEDLRDLRVPRSRKGFPGMSAAWFPGVHQHGPASEFLAEVAQYLPVIRRHTHEG